MVDHRDCDGPRPVFIDKIVIPVGADVKHTRFFSWKDSSFVISILSRCSHPGALPQKQQFGGEDDRVTGIGFARSLAHLFHSPDRRLHQLFQDLPVHIGQ